MENVFGYNPLLEGETGLYIVCDDNSIVRNINNMVKKSGIVGLVDSAGRTHYLIDGRKNGSVTAESVGNLLVNGKNASELKCNQGGIGIDSLICEVLDRYGFDLKLNGYRMIGNILKHKYMMQDSDRLSVQMMYEITAKDFRTSYTLVERNIRYAIKKSSLGNTGLSGFRAIDHLYESLLAEIINFKKNKAQPTEETVPESYLFFQKYN